MSKVLSRILFSIILAFLVITPPVYAETGPKNGDTWQPRLPGPAPAVANPLVVTDVVVDKEAENAVVARQKAITESSRAAFMKLAERNMSPEEFKAFKPPKDSDISMLVQDFEVQDEQMSATRYIGTFTVRFREGVRHYMDVRDDTGPPVEENYADERPEGFGTEETAEADTDTDETVDGEPAERTPSVRTAYESRPSWLESAYGARARPGLVRGGEALTGIEPIAQSVLVLPYFENVSGQTLLWEEQNPWLGIWQGALPKAVANGRQFFVPLGDISDISAGSANGVWSGDYAAIDKLLENYGAEQAVLAVANKSGPELTVEVYTYRNGKLRRRDTLKPYVADSVGAAAFRKGVYETIGYLQAPAAVRNGPVARPVEQISRDILETRVIDSTSDGTQPFNPSRPLVMKPLGQDYRTYGFTGQSAGGAQPQQAVGGATRIEATMQFNDSRSWMDMQRRIAGVMPPVRVDISAMSSNSVSFTLTSDAPAGIVKQSLYSRGVELHPPVMEGGARGTPVYDVRLAPLFRQ